MTTPTIYGPGTPYITPELLKNAPTGITWNTIPTARSGEAAQLAEQMNMCARATAMVDSACNQVLRSTVDTEILYGPDYYITVNNNNGVARAILSRWPITQVLGGRWSPAASFPPDWQNLTASSFVIERPIIGVYGSSAPSASGGGGQAVLVQPGIINWYTGGRRGTVLQVDYINGWPHCSLTASAAAGDASLQVDDCTGWAPQAVGLPGATGVIKDSDSQETVNVLASSATRGPGTLSLSAPLSFGHGPGVVLTTLPETVQQAAILFAVAQALTRGATATTIQSIAGTGQATAAGVESVTQMAHSLLYSYKRQV